MEIINRKKEIAYIATPIYYVNDVPHIGHAYCTIAADIWARWQRLMGKQVYFQTGTDEHGQKIEKTAQDNGETPRQLVDRVVERFQSMWKTLNISNDGFVRTTDEYHKTTVQKYFEIVYQRGDIYLGEYEGWYCRPCETFFTKTQITEEEHCPDCGRAIQKLKEEALFFRMSRYQERLIEHINQHPEFVQPDYRRNEVLGFLREPLQDLCISRTTMTWGIPVPPVEGLKTDKQHYIYVWFDALLNYITGTGYLQNVPDFITRWPADVQLIGKDILKFHAVIWPIMLMAVDLPLPITVFAHGFILKGGEKMSKSKGNVIDPTEIINEFGVDALRYYLMREITFGNDGVFSYENMLQRYNSDLGNDIGNLLNRTLAMTEKYFEGKVPSPVTDALTELDKEVLDNARETFVSVKPLMEALKYNLALDLIWKLINRANRYVEERAPWSLAKAGKTQELGNVMYNLLDLLWLIAILLAPFMPETAQKIWAQLGLDKDITKVTSAEWQPGKMVAGTTIRKGGTLFPRKDMTKDEV